ncbi:polysaccharide pyruvyl transferase family protein [Phycisphaerales bacterium AB-hyl4]|uniref:Polysaccharide pyruvyl transferase family protein n=1 Tax=Natronomicrosphaera hydrolytica TaxID=3242702 RepID=A0ABV4U3U6_9BACT
MKPESDANGLLSSSEAPAVDVLLASLAGKRVYAVPLRGNNGDVLLELAMQHAFRRYGHRRVHRPGAADWICFRSSGAMNDFWCEGPRRLGEMARRFPDTPIVVLPSSFHFEQTDLSALLADRTGPTYLYARERISYRRLAQMKLPTAVHLGLGDDMALDLRDTPLVARWRAYRQWQPRDYVLVVERGDLEHPASDVPLCVSRPDVIEPMFRGVVKNAGRPYVHVLKRARWRRRGQWCCEPLSSEFESECRALLDEHYPQLASLPWRSADVSDFLKYSFREFCSLIAGAAVVVTTRLHAGLMANMLGVPVAFRDGRYGKIAGVYEYSIAGLPGVQLIGVATPTDRPDSLARAGDEPTLPPMG